VALTDLTFQDDAVRYTPQLQAVTNPFVSQNLLSNDTYGEGIRMVDFKLAKNVRFAGVRIDPLG
jgi:hypothetical protein